MAHEAIVAIHHLVLGAFPDAIDLAFVFAKAVIPAGIRLGVEILIAREQFEQRERRARKDDEAHREHDEHAQRFELLHRHLRVSLGGQIRERVESSGVAAHDARGFGHLRVLLLRLGRRRLLRRRDFRSTGLKLFHVDHTVFVGVERLHEFGRVDDAVLVQIHRVELGGLRLVVALGHGAIINVLNRQEFSLQIGQVLGKADRGRGRGRFRRWTV